MENSNSLITDLLDVEKPTLDPDVTLSQVLWAIDYRCSRCSCDTISIRLSDAAKCSNVMLQEDVLSVIWREVKR